MKRSRNLFFPPTTTRLNVFSASTRLNIAGRHLLTYQRALYTLWEASWGGGRESQGAYLHFIKNGNSTVFEVPTERHSTMKWKFVMPKCRNWNRLELRPPPTTNNETNYLRLLMKIAEFGRWRFFFLLCRLVCDLIPSNDSHACLLMPVCLAFFHQLLLSLTLNGAKKNHDFQI